MLVGQYDYAIDAKGRLNLSRPLPGRDGGDLHRDPVAGSLPGAFPAEEFEKVAAKIEEKGLVKGRKVSRMLYASASRSPRTSRAAFSCPLSCGSTRASTTM